MKTPLFRTAVVSAAAALALAACSIKPADPLPPPPAAAISSFTSSAASVPRPGAQVTLTWATENATSVGLEQVGKGPVAVSGTSGSTPVTVDTDTFFVLTARGEGGSDSRALAVAVASQAGSVLFAALPQQVEAGRHVALTWSAPGATAVTLEEVGGATLQTQGQVEAGSVDVVPLRSTSYKLVVDGVERTAAVKVTPVVKAFGNAGTAPDAGAPVTLQWETAGATQLTLTRAGATAPLLTETDAARVAAGTFTDAAPPVRPVDGVLRYRLEAASGSSSAARELEVRIGGSVQLSAFNVPQYALAGATYTVSWTSTGGDAAELWVDGRRIFVAASQTEVNGGPVVVPSPAVSSTVDLVVRNARGAEARATKTVAAVGPVAFTSFTADKATIAAGGEAVTLSWSVPNARNVRIRETTGGDVFRSVTGATAPTGTLVVYPNTATTTYELTANNGAGQSITAQTVSVTVTTPATLTFNRQLPPGATVNVTGSTVTGGTGLAGLPTVELNPTGEAFVDISQTGTALSTTFLAASFTVPSFSATLFGARTSATTIGVSRRGFLRIGATVVSNPTANAANFGTALDPNVLAPYWRDLAWPADGTGRVTWKDEELADARRITVQWDNLEPVGQAGARVSFQAQVYSTGKVVFAYRNFQGVTVDATVGVVNGTETDELKPSAAVASGDVLRFFWATTPPTAIKVPNAPWRAKVLMSNGYVELDGDARIPPWQFRISEVNPFPASGITAGEWLEIANATSAAIDLGGWTLDFGGGNFFTVPAGTMVPASGFLLLAQAADLGAAFTPPGGVTVVTYPTTMAMGDAAGSVSLSYQGGTYSSATWAGATQGVSQKFDGATSAQLTYASGAAAPFACPSTTGPWGTPSQTGTPGAAAVACFPYARSFVATGAFQSIAATGTALTTGTTNADATVYPVTLTRPVRYFGTDVTALNVSTNGFVAPGALSSAYDTNKSSPSTTAPIGVVSPFWDDLDGQTGAGLYWQELDPDSTPNSGDEVTIVSWETWKIWGTFPGMALNFQVKFLANGNIEYHYGAMTAGTASTGAARAAGSSATTWMDAVTGRAASSYNVNSSTAPGVAPNSAVRYTYTP